VPQYMIYIKTFLQRLVDSRTAFPATASAIVASVSASTINRQMSGRACRAMLLVGVMLCSLFALISPASAKPGKTAMQSYVEAMQPGWNLGNTLDAIPTETSWGNPLVTQAMIQQIAAQGYKSIRIPITWTDHTGAAPDYTIDPVWMDRVQQIVDWSLGAGLYVMLNTHHDSWQWIRSMPTNHDSVVARYTAVWTQISTRFASYPNKLMFESINEPQFVDASNANIDDATARSLLDEMNVRFFNIVRGSGGMNATRPLVLPCLGTAGTQPNLDSLSSTITNLNDPNLITTIHFYGYWPFSVNIVGDIEFNTPSLENIFTTFDAVYNTFVAKGIPAVVGEFGVLSGDSIERGEYLKYHEYVAQYIRKKGMTHMFWDAGQLFDRTTFQWKDPQLYSIMMQTVAGRATTADTDLIFVQSGVPNQRAIINLNLNGNRFVSLKDGTTTLKEGVDYEIEDTVLTIKAKELSQYTSGSLGEKTVLTVNVNSGPAWQIHVRTFSPPVLSTAAGSTGGPLVIPAALNGDLLATMEARYADGTPAGPANWTAFKEWGVFLPDYANNTITVTQDFFTGMSAGTVNLTFYFWSGQTAKYQLALQPKPSSGGDDLVMYDDNLLSGWQNWSWATVNTGNTTPVHTGTNSISVDAGAWGALFLGGGTLNNGTYHTLTFWANGGPVGGQRITISATANWDGTGFPSYTIESIPANTWTKFEVPLAGIGVDANPNVTTLTIMNTSGGTEPTFYLDDIHLSPAYASWQLDIAGTVTPVTPPTTSFEIKRGEIHRDFHTNRLVQKVQVFNKGTQPVTGPIYLMLDRLSLNTSLMNATGLTANVIPAGSPYITVTTDGLAPKHSATVTLEFSIPAPNHATGPGHADRGGDDGDHHDKRGGDDCIEQDSVTYTPRILSNVAAP